MAISWRKLGRTIEVVTLIALVLVVAVIWHKIQVPDEYEADEEESFAHYQSTCTLPEPDDQLARSNASGSPTTLKIATWEPEASTWVRQLREAASVIHDQTGGAVRIKFYTGGVQGSDDTVLKKIKLGVLQGATMTPAGLAGYYPDIGIYALPLLFRSAEEVAHVRRVIDPFLHAGLQQAGFESFCFASDGFAYLMSAEPIAAIYDLRGKKVWAPEGDRVSYEFWKAMGVSPQPLPLTDVMIGLQTRLIDVAPVSPLGALFLQWYTKINYVTPLPLFYTYSTLVIDRRAFARIAPEHQLIVRRVLESAYMALDAQSWQDNSAALKAIVDKGVRLVDPSPEFVADIRRAREAAYREIADKGHFSVELYNEVQKLLEDYRARQ